MKTANKITLLRLLMAFLMPVFMLSDIPWGKTVALLIFVLAAATDYLDGAVARRQKSISVFGTLMDPLADKVLICSAFICFAANDQIVPAWIVVVIMTREFMVTGIRLLAANQGTIVPAGRWGKHKTLWQMLVILVILAGEAFRTDYLAPSGAPLDVLTFDRYFHILTYWISALVAVLTVISGTIYFWQCRKLVMKDA